MLRDRTPRQRDFSEVRTGFLSNSVMGHTSRETSFRPQDHQRTRMTPAMSRTPTHKANPDHLRTEFKTPKKTQLKTQQSPVVLLNPSVSKQHMHRTIQKQKPLEYCVDCVNHLLTAKKDKVARDRDQKEDDYLQRCDQILRQNKTKHQQACNQKRRVQTRGFLLDNLEMIQARQSGIQSRQQELAREAEVLLKQKHQAQQMSRRNVEVQRRRQESLQRVLEQQISSHRGKEKERIQEQKRRWDPEPLDRSLILENKERQMRVNREYQQGLLVQINQNSAKLKRDQIDERRACNFDSTMAQNAESHVAQLQAAKLRRHERELQEQIISDKMRKQTLRDQERRQFMKVSHTLQQETQQQASFVQKVRQNKVQAYTRDLKVQIVQNHEKRIREQEFARTPSFSQTGYPLKPRLQECDGCHREVPTKYLSLVEGV